MIDVPLTVTLTVVLRSTFKILKVSKVVPFSSFFFTIMPSLRPRSSQTETIVKISKGISKPKQKPASKKIIQTFVAKDNDVTSKIKNVFQNTTYLTKKKNSCYWVSYHTTTKK